MIPAYFFQPPCGIVRDFQILRAILRIGKSEETIACVHNIVAQMLKR